MSDDTPQDTPQAGPGLDEPGSPGRARRRTALIAVATAAVLLAGGGGVVLATGGGDSGSAAGSKPAPLTLDGVPVGAAEDRVDAPGSPGVGADLRTTGPLPEGPEEAPVYRSDGVVAREDVAALARALGLDGPVSRGKNAWLVREDGKDRQGAVLRVDMTAPGVWSYSGSGGTMCLVDPEYLSDGSVSCPAAGADVGAAGAGTEASAVPAPTADGSSVDGAEATPQVPATAEPISDEEARRATDPLFKALDLTDADVTLGPKWPMRTVTADPEVGGLPTHGWSTTVLVGPDGVESANGRLVLPTAGTEYPTISADRAVKLLKQRGGPDSGVSTEAIAPCPPSGPEKKSEAGAGAADQQAPAVTLPCAPEPAAPPPLRITKAEFGLSSQSVSGQASLVPSWLFTLEPGDEEGFVLAQVAVDPAFLKESPAPADPQEPDEPEARTGPAGPAARPMPMTVESYTVRGRTLSLWFWGGVCQDWAAKASESGDTVRVTVTGTDKKPDGACIELAKQFEQRVQLDEPLGDRVVVDTTSGKELKPGR
ncbi:hypothetical protein AQ490_18360 [Wenjunlia vitaminophila]|uniref:Large membrane protein n=1 Tax=Wenjunlia vitaminophila TaxID=76728 RepID=A0A0T6LUS4_WENVI|nr:hypothetical protein [Wenjunlia vitaminophila]KRV49907.1 hypothetical protein AQ490_18360 [Wenjunlia vitaminophila]